MWLESVVFRLPSLCSRLKKMNANRCVFVAESNSEFPRLNLSACCNLWIWLNDLFERPLIPLHSKITLFLCIIITVRKADTKKDKSHPKLQLLQGQI